jgi:hypothetical protein
MIDRIKQQPCMAASRQPAYKVGGLLTIASSPQQILGKMILPRLEDTINEAPPLPKRIAHACERCRALKAKCTGGQICEKCVIDKAVCRYGDGKRERNKKYGAPLFVAKLG